MRPGRLSLKSMATWTLWLTSGADEKILEELRERTLD
jgi:hypothetical protein